MLIKSLGWLFQMIGMPPKGSSFARGPGTIFMKIRL
jgi:hypothetical protein